MKLIDANEKELTRMTRDTGLNYQKYKSYVLQAQEVEKRIKLFWILKQR